MSNERGNGWLAFVVGLAAGAVLGVLLAPKSGKETRDAFHDKTRGTKDDFDDLIDRGREKWKEARGKAADAAAMTREEVDDFVRFLSKEGGDLWDRVMEGGGKKNRT